jgi:hypothetical protein
MSTKDPFAAPEQTHEVVAPVKPVVSPPVVTAPDLTPPEGDGLGLHEDAPGE